MLVILDRDIQFAEVVELLVNGLSKLFWRASVGEALKGNESVNLSLKW